ncbi:MAG: SGNH/GDSL hydrolase family protein [Bacteroidales bacterium]|nr:SGNH/GDSL hydrolase family protein [Bacteroidales bacterium]
MNTNSRRNFIKKAVAGSFMATCIPEILSATMAEIRPKKVQLKKGDVILFQGDSITDAGRNKQNEGFNNPSSLGSGYVFLAGADLLERYATLDLKIYNRGISGNKVFQLAERWDKDCLEIKPSVLSILIGVNDIWHTLNGNYNGTVEKYRNDYDELLQRTKNALPDVKLIICEPFAVPGVKAVNEKWYPEFYDYQRTAKEIAYKYNAVFVPFQKTYDEAQKRAPGSYWTGDGVHPSIAGAQLMAKTWLEFIQ